MSIFRTVDVSDPLMEEAGLRFFTVQSPAVGRRVDFSLFLPTGWAGMTSLPLVTLLHGVYGSHWVWPFKGGAHRTAAEMIGAGEIEPMAIVMPSDGLWGEGSGYVEQVDADYERWIVQEVPLAVQEHCAAVTKDSVQFIAGLSMGGYGALRLGARYAPQYAGVSAHSSLTDFAQLSHFVEEPLESYAVVEEGGLSVLDAMKEQPDVLPPIRFDCGVDDLLIEPNRALHRSLNKLGVAHEFAEFAGGHEWHYWQVHLRDSLRFFSDVLRSI